MFHPSLHLLHGESFETWILDTATMCRYYRALYPSRVAPAPCPMTEEISSNSNILYQVVCILSE